MTAETWSIVASIVSVVLAFFAIGISIWFFIVGRNTEREVTNSLTQIKTQAEMLQKISGKQLDRLTKYVTEPRDPLPNDSFNEVVKALAQLPASLSATFIQTSSSSHDVNMLRAELINCYIALYFYAAQTNFWSQINLPGVADFDPDNPFDSLCKRMVEMSSSDFNHMANILAVCDQSELNSAQLKYMLDETTTDWRNFVKNPAQVYEQRANQG